MKYLEFSLLIKKDNGSLIETGASFLEIPENITGEELITLLEEDTFSIRVVELSKEEYENLPEFDGF
jgi:hypothetical protein